MIVPLPGRALVMPIAVEPERTAVRDVVMAAIPAHGRKRFCSVVGYHPVRPRLVSNLEFDTELHRIHRALEVGVGQFGCIAGMVD